MYAAGRGVSKDTQIALRHLEAAAAKNDPVALRKLGQMYDSGEGVPVELPRSIAYFRRAAALGDAPSQMQLGLDYATARGVKQDNVEALMWYMLALPKLEGKDRETVETAGQLVAAQMTEDQRNEANYRAASFYEKKR